MNIKQLNTQHFFNLVRNYIENTAEVPDKVVAYKNPAELKLAMDIPISAEGIDEPAFFELINQYLKLSVNTGNKQFFNQLYGGFNLPAFMGEVITALTNTSMYTYEVAPAATLIETELVNKMCQIAGYLNGDGIFVTGGSNANLVAMFSARNKMFPNIINKGVYGMPKLTMFVSDQAHYSFENNANVLGLGISQVYKIKSDSNGRMIPEDLQKQINISIQKGEKPFFVAATAATTMLAAFDPMDEICEIAKKLGIWVHVDGSFGGSLILTQKAKHLFKGIEKTDSFAWNPHKLMNIPLVCSVILVNEKERLYKNLHRQNDDYIFHQTESASCDLGKKSIQCGRKVDALKLWLAWKYYGDEGYIARMNNLLEIAEYFESKVMENKQFELLAPRQSLTVCFRYIPKSRTDIDKTNEDIREELRKTGKSIVNHGTLNGKFAFRWVVANAETTKEDVDLFFDNFFKCSKVLNL